MSVLPRPLFAADGSLLIPKDKYKLMNAIEEVKNEHSSESSTSSTVIPLLKVLVIDAMALIHPLKKSPTVRTLQDLQDVFIHNVERSLQGYDEGRVVFDRYLDMSLKNKTRANRSSTSEDITYLLHPSMRLTMSIRDLLSSTKTKRNLTLMFAKALIEYFQSKPIKFYVVYDNIIVEPTSSSEHGHEEADTLIPHQVLASVKENPLKDITVRSPDTDVLILLLDLVSNDLIDNRTRTLLECSYSSLYTSHFLLLVEVLEQLRYKTYPPLTCSLTSLYAEIVMILLEATFLLQGFWGETFPSVDLVVRMDL